ncbi:MAG: ShlB/FhaC/HecB family hemolysin secretion/activation protein [Cyanobacteriota bacterium]|nr:ShlB/FhaC/HecB family hemolysin secretion/activation protein [Cyanobacteriota bacterium]
MIAPHLLPVMVAQLVAPPLQPGPVRLPAPAPMERPAPEVSPPPLDREPQPPGEPPASPSMPAPAVKGFVPYTPATLAKILAPCQGLVEPAARLQACAAALTTQLFNDGYINSRVVPQVDPAPGVLVVQPGRIERIDVVSSSPALQRRIDRLTQPLKGTVLRLPTLSAALSQLQRLPGVGRLRSSLNRVARDSTRAVLLITVEPGGRPLRGEISLRNDGNAGSGQFRALGTLVKEGVARRGDTLLLFGEVDTDSQPQLGYSSASLSYSLPLVDQLTFTAATGLSRRNLVEIAPPLNDLSFRQQQLYGQFEITFQESLRQRWYGFAGLSLNRNDAFLGGDRVAVLRGGGEEGWVRTAFARLGVGYELQGQTLLLGASVYGLQGIDALTPQAQLQELDFLGISVGESRAIGAQFTTSWRLGRRVLVDVRGAGQLALAPLTEPMGFSLGSDNGLRGLPGQVISGDSGLLGSVELSWSVWQQRNQEFQLVPFLGAGKVWTDALGLELTDSIGAGGVLLRWLAGNRTTVELGWVEQFGGATPGSWNDDWLLGSGFYSRVAYRF